MQARRTKSVSKTRREAWWSDRKVGGAIGLHARDLHIEQVLVDGVEANFEVHYPHNYHEANFHAGPVPAPYTQSNLEAADDAYCKYSFDL